MNFPHPTGGNPQDMSSLGNKGVDIVTQAASDFYTDSKENIKIIDVAAGTGLAALKLQELGFKDIDGIDPSREMKKVALKRNVYKQYYLDFVDGHKTSIETDAYDCAVVSGGFSQGFMPTNALFEIIRIVKPGGVICIEMIESNLVKVKEFQDRLEPVWNKFIDESVWTLIRKEDVPELVTGENGLLMVYKVLVSEITIPQLPQISIE